MTLWPKISIVTPSFNQGKFLEQTIQSVLSQNYPNIEYIIMDGGSTDDSVDIIRKYEERIAFWESKTDKGQADAICRGFEKASGDIITWINSDDYFLPDAFWTVAGHFLKNPSTTWLAGNGIFVDENGSDLLKIYITPISFDGLYYGDSTFIQPSIFFTKDAFFKCGGYERDLKFCFDYDLFLNLASQSAPLHIPEFLSAFRYHSHAKTSTIRHIREQETDFLLAVKHRKHRRSCLYRIYRNIRKNCFIVFHRLRTSGVAPYLHWLASANSELFCYIKR